MYGCRVYGVGGGDSGGCVAGTNGVGRVCMVDARNVGYIEGGGEDWV